MRLKKGFTLAEILIVLMVIGVIATMTIPSMMKGVISAQIKTGYKKALSTISNVVTVSKIAGELPATNISADTLRLFQSLISNLSIKNYVSTNELDVNAGIVAKSNHYKSAIKINGKVYGSGEVLNQEVTDFSIQTLKPSPWIVTEDNMAYSIMCGGTTNKRFRCATKEAIAHQKTQEDAIQASCAIIVVDVNGLSRGPNTYDSQAGPEAGARINTYTSKFTDKTPLSDLTGDQYLIFVGSNGATAGPRATTVTGRIAADLK